MWKLAIILFLLSSQVVMGRNLNSIDDPTTQKSDEAASKLTLETVLILMGIFIAFVVTCAGLIYYFEKKCEELETDNRGRILVPIRKKQTAQ